MIALALLWYRIVQPFLGPALFACLLAVGCQPMHERFEKWTRPGLAAFFSTLFIYVLILVPLAFVVTKVVGEISGEYARIKAASGEGGGIGPYLQAQVQHVIAWVAPRLGIDEERLGAEIAARLEAPVQWMGRVVAQGLALAGSAILNATLTCLILFFFLRDGELIRTAIVGVLPLKKADSNHLLSVISETLKANLYGVVGVALAQGVLSGIGLAIAGIPSPVTWGAVAGLCSMLPVVGPTLVWVPAGIWLLATGSHAMAVFLFVWGLVVVGMADNILRPMLVAGKTEQHPMLVFVSMLGGANAFGITGLFLGPLLISVTIAVFRVFVREMSSTPNLSRSRASEKVPVAF